MIVAGTCILMSQNLHVKPILLNFWLVYNRCDSGSMESWARCDGESTTDVTVGQWSHGQDVMVSLQQM